MTVTRSQTGKTPKKPELPEGFIETPSRRRSTRRAGQTASPSPPDSTIMVGTPTKANGKINGSANGYATGSANGNSNGSANGHANGNTNGHANGSAIKKEKRIIDGWEEGSDPRIDRNPHYEFGGTPGVTAMMLGFPVLMWYMWIGATYYDGLFPTRDSSSQSYTDFLKKLVSLAYNGAYPHARAWAIYWTFFVFEGICYLYMPGVYSKGKPLPHLGGKQLLYYCSGVTSFYLTIFVALALHATGLFKLYTLIDEFGPIMSVAVISGFIVSVVAYVSALWRGAEHRMTGHHIYDFFMGAELNPRLFGWLDFKMFFEVRLPWFILFLVTLGGAARQYETLGYVTGEMGFLLMAHFLYANACCKGEEMISITWDMYYEKWGFMLIFWNLAGVPLSYCHCTIFLANHDPSVYAHSWPVLIWFYTSYLFAYWVWDTGNSQKNMFRAEERGYRMDRKTFPQLPWKSINNPEKIETSTGDSLLCDGWYKYARKIHYTCDLYFAICWGLITGFNSPFPWFYPVFFAVMIVHRAARDIQRCKEKYGDAWVEYERRCPYLFIPYVY